MSRPVIRSARSRNSRSVWLPDNFRAAIGKALGVIGGVAVMLVALALVLALVSYTPRDPSWNTATATAIPQNMLGLLGSYAADPLWQLFGVSGFLLAPVLVAWGWRLAVDQKLELIHWRVIAAVLAMLACATSFAVVGMMGWKLAAQASGALGSVLAQSATAVLSALWLRGILLSLLTLIAVGMMYVACALTLSEWQAIANMLKESAQWAWARIQAAALGIVGALSFLRKPVDDAEDDGFVQEDGPEVGQERRKIQTVKKDAVAEDEEEDVSTQQDVPTTGDSGEKRKKSRTQLVRRAAASARQGRLALGQEREPPLPPLDLLQWPESARAVSAISEDTLVKNAKQLEAVLGDFGVNGAITNINPGPVVTLYELEPAPGTRATRVISLADDISRNMRATSVRVATVPGRNVIGIELPNTRRETVFLRDLLSTPDYHNSKATLPLVLGKDIGGRPVVVDLARMPHLLIAGTTGSGKSVAINTMILSLIYHLPPQKCRFIMVDPKMLELSVYDRIPHLLAPVVTEPKKAIMALRWTVREMEERYRAMSKLGVRNIEGYNMRLVDAAKNGESLTRTVQTGFDRETGKPIYEDQPLDLTELPYIVVIVDEMADLMIVAGKEIETAVQRLAQMARAAGIHILMATQRPSVDVITGTIKANFPTRISFQVTSKIDSRTILGEQGAEQLLGQGDMLYMAGGGRITRVHGPFVSDDDVKSVVDFLRAQGEPEYLDEVTEDDGQGDLMGSSGAGGGLGGGFGGAQDELYDRAVDVVLRERKASTSFVQRQLQIGYNKAANLIERMEREGVIGPANAMGKREVFGRKPDDHE
ncbi:MAG: DNA translocase FtsK 4TM domain-containing protein [Bdellovibrionales bacterium]